MVSPNSSSQNLGFRAPGGSARYVRKDVDLFFDSNIRELNFLSLDWFWNIHHQVYIFAPTTIIEEQNKSRLPSSLYTSFDCQVESHYCPSIRHQILLCLSCQDIPSTRPFRGGPCMSQKVCCGESIPCSVNRCRSHHNHSQQSRECNHHRPPPTTTNYPSGAASKSWSTGSVKSPSVSYIAPPFRGTRIRKVTASCLRVALE
jgi:hypothetical protein